MKRQLLLPLLLLALLPAAHAQMGFNSPPGVTPRQDVEIYSRNVFLVQKKYIPSTAPILAPTIMCGFGSPNLTSPTGILLDPGGNGNYPARTNCTQTITTSGISLSVSVGYELTFTQLDTEADGDSVVIDGGEGWQIAFSGSELPPLLLVPGNLIRVTFKADNDGNVGAGFALRWRLVSTDMTSSGVFGSSLQYDLRKGALVGGYNETAALLRAGKYSTALGNSNTASGFAASALGNSNTASGEGATALGEENTGSGLGATALGSGNTASGDRATALGSGNTASGLRASALGWLNTVSGDYANALGRENRASGNYATVLGSINIAIGEYATALGLSNTASGRNSTAIGNFVSTNYRNGAMILGDNSTTTSTSATANNQLTARFAGGYRFFTSSNLTRGVTLEADDTSWGTISDSTKKERFLPINGPDLLRKIGGMKLTTWNYKGQRNRRHYGPMAQEFFALFGHDALGDIGCDTLLTTQDVEGLTLSAVQALVRENEQLRAEMSRQSLRLQLLEQALLGHRRITLRKR